VRRKIKKITKFNRAQKLILAVFLIALIFTGYQIFRTVRDTMEWRRQRSESSNRNIQGWMRINYAARANGVAPSLLYKALGLPEDPPDRRPLVEIARSQNRSMDEIRIILDRAIVEEHLKTPTPEAGGNSR
jgi:hypothetical protein